MKHPLVIKNYAGSMKSLADDIGDLQYDKLYEFLMKLQLDSINDKNKCREQLSSALEDASESIEDAAQKVLKAWKISLPHMPQ